MTNESAKILLNEAMADGKEYLPRLKQGLADVSTLFQEGREGEAINLFIECLEGLEWFNSVLEGIAIIKEHPDNQENLNVRYRNALQDLLGAWENRDVVLITDLLEYEIIPIIERFLEKVSKGE